jgi:hypothetical protein
MQTQPRVQPQRAQQPRTAPSQPQRQKRG